MTSGSNEFQKRDGRRDKHCTPIRVSPSRTPFVVRPLSDGKKREESQKEWIPCAFPTRESTLPATDSDPRAKFEPPISMGDHRHLFGASRTQRACIAVYQPESSPIRAERLGQSVCAVRPDRMDFQLGGVYTYTYRGLKNLVWGSGGPRDRFFRRPLPRTSLRTRPPQNPDIKCASPAWPRFCSTSWYETLMGETSFGCTPSSIRIRVRYIR